MSTEDTPLSEMSIMEQRAAEYAALADARQKDTVVETVVVLGVGKQKIGISSVKLDIVEKSPPIAYLPGLPRVVTGVLQLRGGLLAAVDIAGWFGIKGGGGSFIAVVVDSTGRKLGLLVDEVIGFREIHREELVEGFFGKKAQGGYPVWGTTRDMITIIDVEKLFDCPETRFDVATL